MFYHCHLKISLLICRARCAKLSKPAVIWTHDRDVRGMGLFTILRHKLQECKVVCDVKSRIDPCLSHHGRGSKLLLVLPSLRGLHGTEKAKFWATMLTFSFFIFIFIHFIYLYFQKKKKEKKGNLKNVAHMYKVKGPEVTFITRI